MSGYGADAVKAITEGRTQQQQSRDLREKIIMGLAQAGLTGAGGIIKGDMSKRASADASLRASASQYAPATAEYAGPTAMPPGWLGKAGEGNHDELQASPPADAPDWMHQPKSMQQRAEEALANGQQNDAANTAPLGGYYTPDGAQASRDQANALTNDMRTAEDGMRGGGMMGSLQRKGMY
jgi:hypothetical protein